MLCCPIASKVKGYPFEVVIPDGAPVSGAVLADQAKSLDWKARRAEVIGKAPSEVIGEACAKLMTLVE